jgi:hypothetical protein
MDWTGAAPNNDETRQRKRAPTMGEADESADRLALRLAAKTEVEALLPSRQEVVALESSQVVSLPAAGPRVGPVR